MPTVSASNSTTSSSYSTSSPVVDQLDRNAFLKLLMTQMQNQDPMKPMEDTAFIAQMAQFSSLEQMQQIGAQMAAVAASTETGAALSLIGRTVTVTNPYDGSTQTGVVNSLIMGSGTYQLLVDDTMIDPSWITQVSQ